MYCQCSSEACRLYGCQARAQYKMPQEPCGPSPQYVGCPALRARVLAIRLRAFVGDNLGKPANEANQRYNELLAEVVEFVAGRL